MKSTCNRQLGVSIRTQSYRDSSNWIYTLSLCLCGTHRISSILERMCSAQEHSFSMACWSFPRSESSLDSSSSARVRPILRFCLHARNTTKWITSFTETYNRNLNHYCKNGCYNCVTATWSLPGSCAGLAGVRPVTGECTVCRAPLGLTPASVSLCGETHTHTHQNYKPRNIIATLNSELNELTA